MAEVATDSPTPTVITEKNLGGLRVGPVAQLAPVLNILVYGDPGVGKTVLAGSAQAVESMSPVLFVDIEGGTLSIRDRYPNVETVRVKTWNDMATLYDQLRRGKTGYKTVVVDSITECQKFGMYHIMKDALNKDPERDPDLPGIGEWGKNTEQMRKFIRAFRDLPMNTIFTALAQADKNMKTGSILTKPAMSAKLSSEVAGFLDIVMYMYIRVVDGKVKRLLLTQGTDSEIAKDRTDKLPPVVEDPSMQSIHDIIYPEGTTS